MVKYYRSPTINMKGNVQYNARLNKPRLSINMGTNSCNHFESLNRCILSKDKKIIKYRYRSNLKNYKEFEKEYNKKLESYRTRLERSTKRYKVNLEKYNNLLKAYELNLKFPIRDGRKFDSKNNKFVKKAKGKNEIHKNNTSEDTSNSNNYEKIKEVSSDNNSNDSVRLFIKLVRKVKRECNNGRFTRRS